jgi:hypothetical protein
VEYPGFIPAYVKAAISILRVKIGMIPSSKEYPKYILGTKPISTIKRDL